MLARRQVGEDVEVEDLPMAEPARWVGGKEKTFLVPTRDVDLTLDGEPHVRTEVHDLFTPIRQTDRGDARGLIKQNPCERRWDQRSERGSREDRTDLMRGAPSRDIRRWGGARKEDRPSPITRRERYHHGRARWEQDPRSPAGERGSCSQRARPWW